MELDGQILKDLDAIESERTVVKRIAQQRFSTVNDQVNEMANYSDESEEEDREQG